MQFQCLPPETLNLFCRPPDLTQSGQFPEQQQSHLGFQSVIFLEYAVEEDRTTHRKQRHTAKHLSLWGSTITKK